MFAVRLVHLIEDHADRLAEGLVRKLKASPSCGDLLGLVTPSELLERAYEIYRNLGDWVLTKKCAEIEERYIGLGVRRARQGVPFSQLLYAIQTTKQHLWDFLRQEGLEPKELFAEMDLLHSMETFFDRAIYFAAIGYETERQSELVEPLVGHKTV